MTGGVTSDDARVLLRERVTELDADLGRASLDELLYRFDGTVSAATDSAYAMAAAPPLDAADADAIVSGCRLLEHVRAAGAASLVDGPLDMARQRWLAAAGHVERRGTVPTAEAFAAPRRATDQPFAKPWGEGLYTSTALASGPSMWTLRADHDSQFEPPWWVWRLEPEPEAAASVAEIRSAADWVRLVEAHPLVRADGAVLPDWEAIATVHAGIHLTLSGLPRSRTSGSARYAGRPCHLVGCRVDGLAAVVLPSARAGGRAFRLRPPRVGAQGRTPAERDGRARRRGREPMTDLITTPFGPATTAAEVLGGVDLSGRRAIVTGGASGIGVETARALAGAGAEVTLAVRDLAAGARTAADIAATTGREAPAVGRIELGDLASVAAFAVAWEGPLDILVNNAGVMAVQELELIGGGWERQFAVNHLGHFALATALHGALAASGAARIVSVSSSGHLRSPVVFDDLHFAFRTYDPWLGYGQAKTANVLFAVGASDRWARDGVVANALMPGGIATNLQRHLPADYIERAIAAARADPRGLQLKSTEQGAATSVLLAASPLVEGVAGRYFEDCHEAPTLARREGPFGVAPYALDRDNAARLWELSERLTTAP